MTASHSIRRLAQVFLALCVTLSALNTTSIARSSAAEPQISADTRTLSGATDEYASGIKGIAPWDARARKRDARGRRNVLRWGRYNYDTGKGWGYRKISAKHNIFNADVWRKTIGLNRGHRDHPGSTTWIYVQKFALEQCDETGCEIIATTTVRSVEQRRKFDGKRKGNITAYCIGRVRCPDWLNECCSDRVGGGETAVMTVRSLSPALVRRDGPRASLSLGKDADRVAHDTQGWVGSPSKPKRTERLCRGLLTC